MHSVILSGLLPWRFYRGGGWDVRGGQRDGDQGTAGPPACVLPCSVQNAQRAARLADATDGRVSGHNTLAYRTAPLQIGITAHHNGRFEFKICRISAPTDGQTWVQAEKAQLTQECFNQVGEPGATGGRAGHAQLGACGSTAFQAAWQE